MTDPKYWGDGIRSKLCFLHGYLLGYLGHDVASKDFVLHQLTDEQITEDIIRLLARKLKHNDNF